MKFAQHEEVIALQQHVAELREGEAAFEPTLDGVFGEHVTDGEVLSSVAKKIDHSETTEPLKIVQQECA